MKKINWTVLSIPITLALLCFVIFVFALAHLAGGINHEAVFYKLSEYVDSDTAGRIVRRDVGVSTNVLLAVSRKGIGAEPMTILLQHPLFPQWRRSELIAGGDDGFYLCNACGKNTLTDEDVKALLNRTFIDERDLESMLECDSISEATKEMITKRLHSTWTYRVRKLFEWLP